MGQKKKTLEDLIVGDLLEHQKYFHVLIIENLTNPYFRLLFFSGGVEVFPFYII